MSLALLSVASVYGVTCGLLWLTGRTPAVPWSFAVYILLVSCPLAVIVSAVRFVPASAWWHRVAAGAVGIGVVWWSRPHVLWFVAGLLLAGWELWRDQARARRLVQAGAVLICGYGAVWNLNALMAPLSVGRLIDPWLLSADLWLTGAATYDGIFPIIDHAAAFALLERAYLFLFAEIAIVTWWLSAVRPDELARWLGRLFTAYAIGVAVFLAIPALGPHIFAPDSLREEWRETQTFAAMHAMAADYQRVLHGGSGQTNYFIALPSLHVAAAVICQSVVRGSLWWLLLPVTILTAASTFLLGYHYALDLPAGLLTAWIAWRLPAISARAR